MHARPDARARKQSARMHRRKVAIVPHKAVHSSVTEAAVQQVARILTQISPFYLLKNSNVRLTHVSPSAGLQSDKATVGGAKIV